MALRDAQDRLPDPLEMLLPNAKRDFAEVTTDTEAERLF